MPSPALDHREDGEVAADLKLDARGLPEVLEEQIDLVVLLLHEADEILVRQPADGEAFRVAQRVVRRQDDRQRVAQQEGRVELLGAGEGEKAAVDLSAAHAAVGNKPTSKHSDMHSANNRFFMLASSYKKF